MTQSLDTKLADAVKDAFGYRLPNLCETQEFATSLMRTLKRKLSPKEIQVSVSSYPAEGKVGLYCKRNDETECAVMFHSNASPAAGTITFESIVPPTTWDMSWLERENQLIMLLGAWIADSGAERSVRKIVPERKPVLLSQDSSNILVSS